NLTSCEYGVDPNRNHHPTALWREARCVIDEYPGPAPASDAEAQAIENLLEGNHSIPGLKPVAFISYHSYGNLLLYPEGYSTTGTMACSLNETGEEDERYCYNPDFQLYRELFGDTHSTLFAQPKYYYRDHGDSILYLSHGDSNLYGQYQAHVLSVTPELPYDSYTDFERWLGAVTSDQRAVLQRVADAALIVVSRMSGGPSSCAPVGQGGHDRA
ncbi:MAG: hypothetical protein KKI08_09575, partial [Armatimonadetes bacterium]|nr:hypothetical protein [Armatimonadota bacterium]